MEIFCCFLFITGAIAVAFRLSWSGRAAASILASALWAGLPWLTSDVAARSSVMRIRSWTEAQDHAGGISAILLVEAIVAGWGALRLAGSPGAGPRRPGLREILALTPSPTFAIGLFGVQVILFNRVSGYGFGLLNVAMSATTVLLLGGLMFIFRSARPRVGLAVPIFVGLFTLAGALPLIVRQPSFHAVPVSVDLRSTAMFAATVLLISGAGFLSRLLGSTRKGGAAR